MQLVLGTLFDPKPECFLLLFGKFLVRLGRWHHFGRILRQDSFDQFAFRGLGGNDRLEMDRFFAYV